MFSLKHLFGSAEEESHEHEWEKEGEPEEMYHLSFTFHSDEAGVPYKRYDVSVVQQYLCSVKGCPQEKGEEVDTRVFVERMEEVAE